MKTHQKTGVKFIVIFLSFFMLQGIALALQPDVGILMRVTGSVIYKSEGEGSASPALSFMKVRKNDQFDLPANSEIQIVYFANGRNETWKGPASFIANDTESKVEGDSKAAAVSTFSTNVAKEVSRISPMAEWASLHRTGSSQVRGKTEESIKTPTKSILLKDEEKAKIEAAKKTYDALLKELPSNDITPEIYLFSVLADYDQYEDMAKLIEQMRHKQPDNEGIERLMTWLNDQR